MWQQSQPDSQPASEPASELARQPGSQPISHLKGFKNVNITKVLQAFSTMRDFNKFIEHQQYQYFQWNFNTFGPPDDRRMTAGFKNVILRWFYKLFRTCG